jgi:hypothetical protein
MSDKIRSLKQKIETKEELWNYLQIAMEVEFSTIPAYLCAIYSIKPGTNQAAIDVMHSVVIEEMFHMTLAGNVLKATNGPSMINNEAFVPKYPTPLPKSNIKVDGQTFEVPLQKFSPFAISETFMGIERPEQPGSPPEVQGWSSIGQFYDGLAKGLDELCDKMGPAEVFNGKMKDQILPQDYYGGSGHFVVVADEENPAQALKNAHRAFQEIIAQGEGMDDGKNVFDCDVVPGRGEKTIPVPAHYYRFDEIYRGRYYKEGDKPHHPTGDVLDVDWSAVYNMKDNPRMEDYQPGSEIHGKLLEFNRTYMHLLNILNDAFSGKRERMMESVGVMYDLKYKAIALMKTPSGEGDITVGPSFEYLSPET